MYKNNKLIMMLILMLCSTYAHSSLIFTDTANTNVTGGAIIGGIFQSDTSCFSRNNNCHWGEVSSNLIDGNANTKYYNYNGFQGTAGSVSIFFERTDDMAFLLEGFSFTTANDSVDRDPISFSFYGTNIDTIEGTNLNDLTFLTSDIVNYSSVRWASYERTLTTNSPAFSNFLVVFDDLKGSQTDAQLSELRLVGAVQVPEPTTLAMFALGVAGLTLRRFKKQS